MEWLIIIGIVVLILFIQFIRSSTVKGFTKGIAKAQLRSFRILKKRYPNEEVRELYIQMIDDRPSYDREKAEYIVKMAEDPLLNSDLNTNINKSKLEKRELNLRKVVLQLAWYEYYSRTGQSVGAKYIEMEEVVNNIIPEEL